MPVMIGSDPELLLVDSNHQYTSVEGLIGGVKGAPVPIPSMDGCGMQEDNVMLEFNSRPVGEPHEFTRLIDEIMDCLHYEVVEPRNLNISKECSASYPASQLASSQAREFGCLPDADAYTGEATAPISPLLLGSNRCAGGHFHLSYNNPLDVPAHIIAQLCDAFCGLWEVRYGIKQGTRRQFYGTAGRYRVKPYGIEYRTPGNGWLFNKDAGQRMAYGMYNLGILLDTGNKKALHTIFTEMPRQEIARCINTEDESKSRELTRFMGDICMEAGYDY